MNNTATTVDWRRAARRAAMLMPPGPKVSSRQVNTNVASMRTAMARAPELVGQVTGLVAAAEIMASRRQLVIDRPGWAKLNAQMFAQMAADFLPVGKTRLSRMVLAEQLGSALALLGTRVLGQYQPFNQSLVLVAPSIVAVQRELAVNPADFHLWVAAHEATHGLQFAAAPWLEEWMTTQIRALLTELSADDGAAGEALFTGPIPGMSEKAAQTMEQLTALMTLLEGHADVVMDEVGPRHIPSVRDIRASFNRRRGSKKPLTVLLNRLLGLNEKLAQYRNGAKFCRAVIAEVGHEGLNQVFAGEQYLPTTAEIAEPHLWLARMPRRQPEPPVPGVSEADQGEVSPPDLGEEPA